MVDPHRFPLLATIALIAALALAACGGSNDDQSTDSGSTDAESTDSGPNDDQSTDSESINTESPAPSTPGGYNFDRSDPEGGVANIIEAFATDRETAECIYEAWGDVANVEPAELTPELMTFPICGTSIFQMMTGDGRFTGRDS